MHLKDIEIKNFKSIRHQKIEGCKRINLFIGYPNVGKSNILEALSFLGLLQNDAQLPTLRQLVRVEEFFELFYDGNIQEEIEIKYFDTRSFKINYYTQKQLKAKSVIYKSDIYLTNSGRQNLFGSNSYNNKAEFVERDVIFENDTRAQLLVSEWLSQDNIFNDFFEGNFQQFRIRKYEYAKSVRQDKTNFEKALSYPYGENLYFTVSSNEELRKELVDILSEYGLKLFFEKGDRYQMKAMKVLTDDTVFTIPFYQIADTLQRLIFYKAAIQTNRDTILIFEEPEAHMFPPYVRRFANDIAFEENKNQFFIATHSPYVLDAFLEEAKDDVSIYLVDYKKGETIIKQLKEEDIDDIRAFGVDFFFNIENYLKGD